MCHFTNDATDGFGYIVDNQHVRHLIAEAQRLMRADLTDAERVAMLRPIFAGLLASDGWLPDEYAQPDLKSGMGGGIGQYALYRAEDGSLCLFSLVVPVEAATPVHDHLAWGLVGVYRGRQQEVVYRRTDDGREEGRATLQIAREHTMDQGEFYTLLPPTDDIHKVKTVSAIPSVSIHLLANDTACVWRHRFDPDAGTVAAFRSGYSNAPCPPESPRGA